MKASISLASEESSIWEGEICSASEMEGIVDLLIRVEVGEEAFNCLRKCLQDNYKIKLLIEDTEATPLTLQGYIKRARFQPLQSSSVGCHLSMAIDS